MAIEHDEESGESKTRSWFAALSWTAMLLFGTRAVLIFGMDRVAHGVELDSALWRLGRAFLPTVGSALGAAAIAATGFTLVRRGPLVARLTVGLAAAALFAWILSGAGIDLATRVPGTDGARGALAWAVLLSLAGGLSIALASARIPPRAGGGRLLALPWAVLLVAGVLSWAVPTPRIAVHEVARALLEEEGAWETVRTGQAGEPHVGVLTPVLHWRAAGGERPALVVPPGGEVSFRVRPEDGAVCLRTAAGVDRTNFEKLYRGLEELRFRFEVLVDGELASEVVLALDHEMAPEQNEWHALGGEHGIELRPGSEVRLRTSVESDPDDERVRNFAWRIGFADPVLERTREWRRALSAPGTPNIVLILMDTQRRDRLGCYGYGRDTSPNVDRLARRGLLYDDATATSSWTWPSTASVLTGLDAEQHGVVDDDSCYLPRSVELLSEALQRKGYSTAGFSGSPLISPSKNFDQGFEHFDAGGRDFRKSRAVVPKAIEWMETFAGQRFFLYLHLVDPHDPHQPDPEALERFAPEGRPADFPNKGFTGYTWALRKGRAKPPGEDWDTARVVPPEHQRWISDVYDACVWSGDRQVGEVLEALADLGLEDETVVAFTADHGEELFDHGMLEHAHSLHGELVGVPLILAGPGIPRGAHSDAVVSNRHLATTLARIGGADLDGVEDGQDLSRPDELVPRPIVFGTRQGWWNNWYRTPLQGLRDGDWILHWAPLAGPWGAPRAPEGGEVRLYDRSADPDEHHDLAREQPERAAALRARLEALIAEQRQRRTTTSIGAGEGTLDMLNGIGYIESGESEGK